MIRIHSTIVICTAFSKVYLSLTIINQNYILVRPAIALEYWKFLNITEIISM